MPLLDRCIKSCIPNILPTPPQAPVSTPRPETASRLLPPLLRRLKGPTQTVRGLSFLGKGQVLVSTGWGGTVRFWGVDDGKVRGFLPGQGDAVHCLSVSPDGQTLALGLQDRTVKLWDISCGQLRAVFAGHTREVNDVVFCPNGHYLVSASAANAAWWVKRGEVLVWKAPP